MKLRSRTVLTTLALLIISVSSAAPLAYATTIYSNPSASGSAFCGGGSTENLGFISVVPGNAVTVFTFGSAGSNFGGGVASFAIFSDSSYSNLVQTGSLGGFSFGYPSGGVSNYAVFVSGFLPSGYWQISLNSVCSPFVSTAGYNGLTIDQELPPPGTTTLGQFIADGTTPIAEGGVTTGTTVVFRTSIQTSSSTDPLQFQVEVQPSANGFSGNPTVVASSSEGHSVTATVSGLQDGSYHWTARVYDPVTHAATPWQPFSSSTTHFIVADALIPTSSTVLTDATTIYSAGNGFVGGCCPNTVMSPGPVFYQAPTPFAIQSIVVDDTDFSSNNHDGVGNIRASIYDLHGNLIARSTNTLYGESGCTGCGFAFSGETVPQDFQLSLVVEDGIQGDGGFTVRNLRFFIVPQTGTIVVSTNNPAATFTITDEAGHTFIGSGIMFTEAASPGRYTITFGSVPGYIPPPSQVLTLTSGASISFSGLYTAAPLSSQPSSLSFSYRTGTTVTVASQDIVITGSPGIPISISASSDDNWLLITPNSGADPLTAHVSVSSKLHRGAYTGQIIADSATGAQLTIPVNLTVTPTMSYILLFAQTADGPAVSTDHTAAHFRDLISQLRIYHLDNSYGLVNVSVLPALDADVPWHTVDILSKYVGNEKLFINDVMKAAGLLPATLQADGIIVVHNGPSSQTTDGLADYCKSQESHLCTETGFLSGTQIPWILVSEDDLVGAWAHEVGHDLGTIRGIWTLGQPPTMLPHPTISSVGCWDLMALGGWGSGSPNCNANAIPPVPAYMSSLSRATLGFIEYNRVMKEDALGEHTINSLETADQFQKVLNIQLNQTDCYVAEVRNNSNLLSLWDISVPTSGLVLYHVATDGNSNCGELTLAADGSSAETVNVRPILKAPGLLSRSQFKDYANGLTFQTFSDGLSNGQYSMQFVISHLNNESPAGLFGVVVSGGTLFTKVSSFFADIPPASPVQLPDLDLHAYADDGRHVGLNYVTGEFENQLSADASGDQFNGQEWIVMPANTEGVHFVVSGFKTLQFLQQFPNFQSVVGQVDQASIAAIAIAPAMEESVPPSTTQTINIGGWTEIPLTKIIGPDGSVSVVLGSPKPTIDSLIAELSAYANAFKNPGIGNALAAKLRAAKEAIIRNARQAALGQLTAFENQIRADNLISVKMIEAQLLTDTDAVIKDLQ